MQKNTIAIIGAGPMGLACAYEFMKLGHTVDIYERDDRIGGMSASFDFAGLKIERYYHFICKTDYPLFDLLKELDLSTALRWRETKMGFFYQGNLYKWGNPLYLLQFPHLNLLEKLRYGAHVMYAKTIQDWSVLDKIYATDWIKSWVGERVYETLWKSLFALKFFEFQNDLSAAWIGTRIKRVALSRKSLFTEELGYLEGGSDTLLDKLEAMLLQGGCQIFLQTGINKVVVENNQVQGVIVNGQLKEYQTVISTIPLPYTPHIVPDLSPATREKISQVQNIGVACVIFKLSQPLTANFWLNINDPDIQIPGLIEYSNLNPTPHSIVYAPFYMPTTNPKYHQQKQKFIDEVLSYLPRINPEFKPEWVLASHVSRYEFAQTVCTPHFFTQLPPMQSEITGFFMADTSYYYPEDRSISESIKVGKELTQLVMKSIS